MDNQEKNHSFDNMYEDKKEMFGHPYKELQDYFKNYQVKGKVLDLGCGQGRDALFLASIGYDVTAVDNSGVGIKQMLDKAKEQKIELKGIVDDVLNLKINDKFEIILFDMLLHSFEKEDQVKILEKNLKLLKEDGILCIVFPNDLNSGYFMDILNSLSNNLVFLEEIIINDVPKIEGETDDYTFSMMVVKSS